jgi:hypothetical protein
MAIKNNIHNSAKLVALNTELLTLQMGTLRKIYCQLFVIAESEGLKPDSICPEQFEQICSTRQQIEDLLTLKVDSTGDSLQSKVVAAAATAKRKIDEQKLMTEIEKYQADAGVRIYAYLKTSENASVTLSALLGKIDIAENKQSSLADKIAQLRTELPWYLHNAKHTVIGVCIFVLLCYSGYRFYAWRSDPSRVYTRRVEAALNRSKELVLKQQEAVTEARTQQRVAALEKQEQQNERQEQQYERQEQQKASALKREEKQAQLFLDLQEQQKAAAAIEREANQLTTEQQKAAAAIEREANQLTTVKRQQESIASLDKAITNQFSRINPAKQIVVDNRFLKGFSAELKGKGVKDMLAMIDAQNYLGLMEILSGVKYDSNVMPTMESITKAHQKLMLMNMKLFITAPGVTAGQSIQGKPIVAIVISAAPSLTVKLLEGWEADPDGRGFYTDWQVVDGVTVVTACDKIKLIQKVEAIRQEFSNRKKDFEKKVDLGEMDDDSIRAEIDLFLKKQVDDLQIWLMVQ